MSETIPEKPDEPDLFDVDFTDAEPDFDADDEEAS